MKLGKCVVKQHPKTLALEKYVGAELLAPPPEKVYWSYKVPEDQWGVLGNDVAGDCVIAMAMHMIMNWTAHTGTMKTFSTEQALELYSSLTGFDPITGANDNGLGMTDFLNYWQTTGIYGDKILGWASFNATAPNTFSQAEWLFGGAAIGVQFPKSAMTQFDASEAWSVVPDSPTDGGHALPFFNFGSKGRKCVTWGQQQDAQNAWLTSQVDEAYAVITQQWFDTVDVAPNHFKKDQLWADLNAGI
jgi:hypothetical protein